MNAAISRNALIHSFKFAGNMSFAMGWVIEEIGTITDFKRYKQKGKPAKAGHLGQLLVFLLMITKMSVSHSEGLAMESGISSGRMNIVSQAAKMPIMTAY